MTSLLSCNGDASSRIPAASSRWNTSSLNSEKEEATSGLNKMPPSSGTAENGDANLPQNLLYYLEKHGQFDTLECATSIGEDHQKIVGAVKSLQTTEGLVETEERTSKSLELTAEGREMAENGSHEAKVFRIVGPEGAAQTEIMKLPFGKVGISKAIASGWIAVDKSGGIVRLIRKTDEIDDKVQRELRVIADKNTQSADVKVVQELKKRKLITEISIKSYLVRKGQAFSTVLSKPEVDLTADMISSGSWRTKAFKKYNFDALGLMPAGGHLHPLMKVRSEFRQIFFQMGFVEMPTNR
ncbi:unnamed protein product [Gongylonema pulchrum]|uniref:PheRS_DBD3 domain-containing protein n=1 Tax=Gongylonema pulchrum TaxID=637853 RepID=A0A183D2D7_9BILA|nr:unnamed protein product [Gongylonema pulchrum]